MLERIETIQSELTSLSATDERSEWEKSVLEALSTALEELRLSESQLMDSNRQLYEIQGELRHERTHYKTLFELAPDAFFLTDADGAIVECNTNAGELLEVRRDLLERKPLAVFIHPEMRDDFYVALRRLTAGHDIQNWNVDFSRRSAEAFPATVSARVIPPPDDESGETYNRILWVVRDRSLERKMEERIHRSQMRESIGTMAAGIAHEFNNILSLILTWVELGVRDSDDDSQAGEAFDRIKKAAMRGAKISESILSFGRNDTVEMDEEIELGGKLESTGQILDAILTSQVELTIEPSHDELRTTFDPGLLQQVLINLVLNAKDAIGGAGKISVTTDVYRFDYDEEIGVDGTVLPAGEYVAFSVHDEGCGMTDETLAAAIEPYFSTKGEDGTGLGLSTVLELVGKADGAVQIESEPDAGTSVTVYLPSLSSLRAEERVPTPPEAFQPVEPIQTLLDDSSDLNFLESQKTTVLIVDDTGPSRAVLRHFLQKNGYQVIELEENEEPFSALAEFRGIDIVVVNSAHEAFDGPEFVNKTRRDFGVEVVVVENDVEDWGDVVPSGVIRMERPVRETDLVAAVEEAVEHLLESSSDPAV